MADIEIEIDGRTLTAKANETIIQVADRAGIYIPRFCYHQALSVAANCRMCLVDVEKSPKTLPACATPIMPGMKVFTKSAKTIAAQRAVMEFLLINHPLDCPICDQGGECELQDLAFGYGDATSHYDECKRAVSDEDIGPLIATEMTRCILCTRCVRFGDEVAGLRELGVIGRGEDAAIRTYIRYTVHSELSGNIIDLCPVGALTNKPYRYTARPWELQQAPSIAPHDCVGSNLNIHTRNGNVMRVVARENEELNETWLADRDRYSYTGLYHGHRLAEPMARVDGQLQVVSWEQAFAIAARGLQETIAKHGADQLGALASPNATLEEFYLLQKIMRGLGSPHLDHRLREMDTSDQEHLGDYPGLPLSLAALQACDAVLLIGSNIRKEQPLLGSRLRKAALQGAAIVALNAVDYVFNFPLATKKIITPTQWVQVLSALLQALTQPQTVTDTTVIAMAAALKAKQKICILLGASAWQHPEASQLRYLAQQIATHTGATLGFLTPGANTAGAWLAGLVPHRHPGAIAIATPGLSAYDMLKNPRKAYVLLNVEPDYDMANAALAQHALQQATFVLALSLYRNPVLEATANVILPIVPYTETSGTFINAMNMWQSFNGVATPYGASRPAWKVLRVLGNFLELDDFAYASSEAVKDEVKAIIANMTTRSVTLRAPQMTPVKTGLSRLGDIPIYATDSLVRRAKPLQAAQLLMEGEQAVIRLHPETAKQWQLAENEVVLVRQRDGQATLPVLLDARVALDVAFIAGGIAATSQLGDLMGDVIIERMPSC